ncbi:MAG TPA: hypothetical protein VE262_09130 [Blastocatellia bacterium]|nr:hypothetical protein [Blastocatellia bacterium]
MERVTPDLSQQYLNKVIAELGRYEHPLFRWEAKAVDRGIEVTVRLKIPDIHDDPYRFYLTPRELNDRAFPWDFQRQLYNYLHDYLVEMFTRSPQIYES